MSPSSRHLRLARRAAAWSAGWLLTAALYLLLIDTTRPAELIVGAAAAAIAATVFELAREQHLAGMSARLRWLGRLHRPLVRAPADIAVLCVVAAAQLVHPRAARGRFRAVSFRGEGEEAVDAGRRALAEALGSFAPNTIVVGVDAERSVLIAHQLRPTGATEALDVLGLG